MKVQYFITILLSILISTFAFTYYADDPMESFQQTATKEGLDYALADTDNPITANHVLLTGQGDFGRDWVQISCANKTAIVASLHLDAQAESSLPRGACCINPHHYVCQLELSNIRTMCGTNHTGKGGNTTGCPA